MARSANDAYVLTAAVDQSKTAVGISDPYWSYGLGDVESDLDAMVALGVTNVRIQVPWVYVEPEEGVYDWALVDEIVQEADERGLGIVAIVSHTPAWAGSGGVNSPPDPAVYADFAGEVADRYQGSITAYEIWNEPNGTLFYDPADPDAYTELLQAAYSSIKAVDSSNIVVAGVLGSTGTVEGVSMNPVEFVEAMYSAGAKDSFDVLSFHPYAYPLGTEFSAGAGWPGSAYEQLQAIWVVMEENSDSKPIWATEFGVPTVGDTDEAAQAAIITDFLSAWSDFSYTGPMFIHTASDLNSASEVAEENFGIFYTNGDPKLAAEAIEQWIEEHQEVEEPPQEPPTTSPMTPLEKWVAAIQAFFAKVVAAFRSVSSAVTQMLTGLRDSVVAVAAQAATPKDTSASSAALVATAGSVDSSTSAGDVTGSGDGSEASETGSDAQNDVLSPATAEAESSAQTDGADAEVTAISAVDDAADTPDGPDVASDVDGAAADAEEQAVSQVAAEQNSADQEPAAEEELADEEEASLSEDDDALLAESELADAEEDAAAADGVSDDDDSVDVEAESVDSDAGEQQDQKPAEESATDGAASESSDESSADSSS